MFWNRAEIKVDPDLAKDPNYKAFKKAKEQGAFKEMEPGTWVVFLNGKLFLAWPNKEEIFNLLRELKVAGFIKQVNCPETVVHIPRVALTE